MMRDPRRTVQIACVLCLVSLGLMTWSILDPSPIPVVVAMSAGQVFGTLGLLLYAVVVLRDVMARRLLPNLLSGQRASLRPPAAKRDDEAASEDAPPESDEPRAP